MVDLPRPLTASPEPLSRGTRLRPSFRRLRLPRILRGHPGCPSARRWPWTAISPPRRDGRPPFWERPGRGAGGCQCNGKGDIGRVRSSVGSLRFHANRGCFALGHGGFDRKRIVDILRGIAFHAVLPPPGASRSQSASTNRRGWKRLERVPAPLRKSSAGAPTPAAEVGGYGRRAAFPH